MRVLIFALLALAVDATSYGYGKHYGGYPSYSYSSYPSTYYGGYGSSLYGANYGSYGNGYGYGSGLGYGYGSGLGYAYGSGSGYGVGGTGSYYSGGIGTYTTAYKPAVYHTGRYSYQQPYNTGAVYKSRYVSGDAPGKIEFILGGTGYQTGTSALSGYNRPPVLRPAGVFSHGTTSVHRSTSQGAVPGNAIGRINFSRDFSRVTGQSGLHRSRGVAGVSTFRKPILPATVVTEKHSGVLAQGAGSLHKTGVQEPVSDIHFQEVTEIGGADFTGAGLEGISAPATLPKPFSESRGISPVHKKGAQISGSTGAQISFTQDFSKVTGQSGIIATRPQITSFDKVSAPVVAPVLPKVPTGSFHDSASIRKSVAHGTAGHSQISFTQDFSKVTGLPAGKPEIHSFNKVSAPVTSIVSPRIPSRSVGVIHKSEVRGTTAGQPHISFTRDFSKFSGLTQQIGIKPETHSFDKVVSPPIVGTVPQHGSVPDIDSFHKTRTHGISGVGERGQIVFTQGVTGVSGVRTTGVKPAAKTTSGVSTLPKPSSGSRVTGALPKVPAQDFHGPTGPSRISFTQDFSKVAGHQISGVKPIISFGNKLTAPVIPAVFASPGYQAVRRNPFRFASPVEVKLAQRPVTDNLAFKAAKQPVKEQPSITAVYDQSPVHTLFPVREEGHVVDKSIFTAEPANGHIVDYKHEISSFKGQEGDKLSSFVIVPEANFAHDKSSAFRHSGVGAISGGKVSGIHLSSVGVRGQDQLGGTVSSYEASTGGQSRDKSNIFVVGPAEGYGDDKSTILLHTSGVAPTGSFVEEKGSVFEFSSGVDSAQAKRGQSQGYNAISTPFKSHYTSSYPGYSHVTGESPRFDFSHDRSLLYTYSSPYLVSPFSYSYTTGNKGYVGRKTIA